MSEVREGGCACGEVRYRLTSDPMFVNCCHCRDCQRQTGSAFVINLVIEADRVELLSGAPEPVPVPREEGPQLIWRCATCRVALFSRYTNEKVRYVRGGTLDEPSSLTPGAHIFTRSQLPWVELPPSALRFETYYELEETWPPESLARLADVR